MHLDQMRARVRTAGVLALIASAVPQVVIAQAERRLDGSAQLNCYMCCGGASLICQPTNSWEGLRAISRLRIHARLAATTVGALALIAPSALLGQGFDHRLSAPPNGPAEALGRAGISARTLLGMPISPTTPITDSDLVPRDTSGHHGSRAHHVAVGAMIGGAAGLLLGIAGDRPGLGRGETRGGHFHNLWLVTAPLGAGIGALIGVVPQAD